MKLASIIKTRLFYTGTFTCFIQILDEAYAKILILKCIESIVKT